MTTLADKISGVVAAISLIVALIAGFIAWFGIRRANMTTSASTYVALNEAIRQAWERFFAAQDIKTQQYEIGEVLNLLEIACALYIEKSLDGASGELMVDYLQNILKKLVENSNAHSLIDPLLQSEKTFIYIRKFLDMKATSLSVTIPPKWYQLPPKS